MSTHEDLENVTHFLLVSLSLMTFLSGVVVGILLTLIGNHSTSKIHYDTSHLSSNAKSITDTVKDPFTIGQE